MQNLRVKQRDTTIGEMQNRVDASEMRIEPKLIMQEEVQPPIRANGAKSAVSQSRTAKNNKVIKIKQSKIPKNKAGPNIKLRKSFNNLSLADKDREMMDMHFGGKREPIQLYKLEMTRTDAHKILKSSELKSDHSIDRELYSTSQCLLQESPRTSVVQFTDPLPAN